jgi:DNA-binding NarL/FixJ family response regulator
MALRILVIESHSLVAAAFGAVLGGAPLFALVETALDVEAATATLDAGACDLVVCELPVFSWFGPRLVDKLAQIGRDVPILLLSSTEEEQLMLEALTSGATGFFTKDCAPDDFIAGVNSVLRGHYTVGNMLKPGVVARLAGARKRVAGPR